MENATKALLIAAAVLVAIIIISLTLVFVRQGQEAVAGADMSEAEVAQFNSKFNTWNGKKISTTQLNALINMVFMHDKQEILTGNKRYVSISVKAEGDPDADVTGFLCGMYVGSDPYGTPIINDRTTANINSVPKISGKGYYSVKCKYNNNLISSIMVEKIT